MDTFSLISILMFLLLIVFLIIFYKMNSVEFNCRHQIETIKINDEYYLSTCKICGKQTKHCFFSSSDD